MDLSLHACQRCPIAISNRVENRNWLVLVLLTRWRTNRKIISVSNRPVSRYPMSQGAPVSPKSKPKSAGLVALASPPIENNNQNYVAKVTRRVHNVTVNPVNVKANEVFRPFISKGSITYDGKNYPVDILRDTGCALSLILKSAIPSIVDDDGNTNGQYEIVKGVGDILTSVPLINLTLNSEFVNDDVVVGLAENIPVPGITFLLGNDLAKEKVTSENPRMIKNKKHKQCF